MLYKNLKSKLLRTLSSLSVAVVVVVAFTTPSPRSAYADTVTPPSVPANIQPPAGNKAFLVGHAEGTQDYVCLSTGWASPAYGPQATLFDDDYEQILTHFLSRNPDESNTPRPTWQDSRDSSTVWANQVPGASYTPDPTAIPWLLLQVTGKVAGPTGGDRMTVTTYIQRVNTTGGLRPTGACTEGAKALVPYTADYYFYKSTGGGN